MAHVISPEIVVACSQCPWKAFLLLRSENQGTQHEYVRVLEEQARRNKIKYLNNVEQEPPSARSRNADDLMIGEDVLIDVPLKFHDLEADHCVLYKVNQGSSLGNFSYSPMIFAGTYQVTKEQKLALLFVGYVLGKIQNLFPLSGTIVEADGQAHKIGLESADRTLKLIIDTLRRWTDGSQAAPPPMILNKHCSTCQFQMGCLDQAEKDDNLSLLDRITAKKIRQYQKKGIFTVTQLSYLFKPRRRRKRSSKAPASFNVELQALALRTGKIYIQEIPELSRQETELFLDIEGLPDQDFQYLIGLFINERGNCTYHSFWANTPEDERQIWVEALEKMNENPETPIYHYGSYEPRAIDRLAQKYMTDCDELKKRFVNLNASIFGKLYFPTRSNALKILGKYIGASWSAPDASGLQSMVWRHQWEETGESSFKENLLIYNREDCEASWLLTEELSKIIASANTHENIDFADRPKQHSSEIGNQIHTRLQSIIRFAHADYKEKRVSIRPLKNNLETASKKRGAQKGHQAYHRVIPSNVDTVIQTIPRTICPKHEGESLVESEELAQRFIINLLFTKTGCRKTVTKYVGAHGYCRKCHKLYPPLKIEDLGNRIFGHAFQAWAIYERIVLRLPYRIIIQEMEDMFNESVTVGTIVNFIKERDRGVKAPHLTRRTEVLEQVECGALTPDMVVSCQEGKSCPCQLF